VARGKSPTKTLVWIFAMGALLWPAIYNGQPFFFSDTTAYVRGADAAVQKLTGHATPWSEAPTLRSVSSVNNQTVLAGRSPYYGLLLYSGEITGGFWLSVALQAAAVLAAIALTLRAAQIPIWPYAPAAGIILAAVTGVPFFASYLMPDLFAGVAVLGCAVLLAVRRWLGKWQYVAWLVLVALSLMVHDSHVLIAAGMLLIATVLNLRYGWANWRGLTVVLLALVITTASQFTFDFAVKRLTGAAPVRPPVLTARLIDDGPGYEYLKATCPQNGFTVCQSLDRLPLASDDFLWGTDNTNGIFSDASPEIKRRLGDEQYRFLLAVLRYDPVGEIMIALSKAGEQLSQIGLGQVFFEYNEASKRYFASKIPSEHQTTLQQSAAYRHMMPMDAMFIVQVAAIAAALGLLILATANPTLVRLHHDSVSMTICRWVLLGVVLNSLVCGGLSIPQHRYSARVVWLIPFVGLLVGIELLRGRPWAARVAQARGASGDQFISGT
jgi:hypothetical protein